MFKVARAVPALDADDIVHEALGPSTPIASAIAAHFGEKFLNKDGAVNRQLLAATVFSNPDARRQLEAIVHPAVYGTIRTWFAGLGKPFGIASIPLLYETGRDGDFDFVAVTVCAPAIQLDRLMARDGMARTQAQKRISAQMPTDEKAARGNFVIRTDGDTSSTDRQVDELLAKLEKLTNST